MRSTRSTRSPTGSPSATAGCTSTRRSGCGHWPTRRAATSSPGSTGPTRGRRTATSGSTSPTTAASLSSAGRPTCPLVPGHRRLPAVRRPVRGDAPHAAVVATGSPDRGVGGAAHARPDGVAGLVADACDAAVVIADRLRAAGATIVNDVVLNQVLVRFGDAATTSAVLAEVQADGRVWCGPTTGGASRRCASACRRGGHARRRPACRRRDRRVPRPRRRRRRSAAIAGAIRRRELLRRQAQRRSAPSAAPPAASRAHGGAAGRMAVETDHDLGVARGQGVQGCRVVVGVPVRVGRPAGPGGAQRAGVVGGAAARLPRARRPAEPGDQRDRRRRPRAGAEGRQGRRPGARQGRQGRAAARRADDGQGELQHPRPADDVRLPGVRRQHRHAATRWPSPGCAPRAR